MVNIKKVNGFCENEINVYTRCKCRLVEEQDVHFSYFLTPDDYSNVNIVKNMHGKYVKAIQMKNGFFLYFNISYVKINAAKINDIKDVSLQFYTQDEPFARAEWTNIQYYPELSPIHPQPHWHIIPHTIYLADETKQIKGSDAITFLELLEQETHEQSGFMLELSDVSKPKILHFEDLHYAMNEDWVNGNNHGVWNITENGLRNWLRGCLESVNGQMNKILIK